VRSVASQTARARRDEIVRLATTTGLASVEELSTLLGVTASTIRRDLAKLTTQGKLARTYGGAMSLAHHPEAPLRQRLGEAYSAKHAIARWAASQVRSGETILLDAGSTAGALAEELRGAAGLTAMSGLAEAEGIDVIALGGRLRPLSQAFVGPLTEAAVSRISFDRAFMGADGVHAERGICEASLDQTRLKELMMGRAEHTYVLAHAAKLGQAPFHAWAVMPARWTLVTDESADPAQLEPFRDRGVEVVVAPS
jgi:DeoR/GlpR family transcriptional regulator of sugar metabolism